jgi:DNA-binding NtrC family response regulator
MLAVLQISEAFGALWPEIADHLRLPLHRAGTIPELGSACRSRVLVVAAGGAEGDAIDAVRGLRDAGAGPVLVVGAATDHRSAVLLLTAGADAYFALPGDLSLLRARIAELVERFGEEERVRGLAAVQRQAYAFAGIVGGSPALLGALDRARRVIPSSTTVLITGETGTGKELLAQAIHYNGPRGKAPLVEINCAALPASLIEAEFFGYDPGAFTDARTAKPGLFEVADGGTLFLDEIAELPLELQAKLLRVLDTRRVRRLGSVRDREVDVRLIAATHRDLARRVGERQFREDLFYRLNVVPVHLPALRERGDDVLLLAQHFLAHFAREIGVRQPRLSAEVRKALLSHSWPGNVRELRNAVERAVVLSDGVLDPRDLLPPQAGGAVPEGPLPFPATLAAIERSAARAMVERFGGNKSRAARALGVTRKRLYALLGGAPEESPERLPVQSGDRDGR